MDTKIQNAIEILNAEHKTLIEKLVQQYELMHEETEKNFKDLPEWFKKDIQEKLDSEPTFLLTNFSPLVMCGHDAQIITKTFFLYVEIVVR